LFGLWFLEVRKDSQMNRLTRCCVAAWLLCSLSTAAWAQPVDLSNLLGGKKPRTPKPDITATLTPDAVRPGDEVTVALSVKLPAGYYIYGTNRTFSGRTRIETKLTGLEPVDDGFTPDQPGKTLVDPDLQEEVTKHYDKVVWSRKYRVTADATGDTVSATGTLQGQYCSGPEAGGLCVQITPPYRFELTAKLTGASPSPAAATPASYSQRLRPTRPRQGGQTADPVEYELRLSPPNATRGGKVTVFVTAWLDAGWHTYSLTQKGNGGAPTEIELGTVRNLKPLGDGFAADRTFVAENTDSGVLEIHHDRVTWSREFEVTTDQPGDYGVEGSLTYAVCDVRSCLPVKAIEFVLGQVTGSEAAPPTDVAEDAGNSPFGVMSVVEDNVAAPAEPLPAEAPVAAPVRIAQPQDKGLVPFLVLCVLGGFGALLTPCSFPMVPITVGFFLKQSELQHKRPWVLALVYCGTIVLTFTVLGVGIAAIFGAAKLNELANNGWLNLVISLVFIAFALSMLGAFEIHVPSSLLTWSASHETGGSYLGAVFMALTFTLTSFTCTFAIVGFLLVQAAVGEVFWPVVGMLAFGTAFASPFFVLALLPSLLRNLPRSGGWMNSVKVVMGLIELGAAVKFLSVADLAWNPTPVIFDYVTVMLIWMVLSLAIGCYLLGWFRLSHDLPVQGLSTFRASMAFSFLGMAFLLGYLTLQPDRAQGLLMDQIVAFAPPRFDDPPAAAPAGMPGGVLPVAELGPTLDKHGLLFALDLDKAIPVARQRQQPLLLDFTGVNCINCRRMEKKMVEPANRQLIEQCLAVALYADKVPHIADAAYADRLLSQNVKLQVEWFGSVSLPSYAVVAPDGKTILSTYIGYEAKSGEFTEFLQQGLQKWQATQAAGVNRAAEQVAGR
jgi:thiol:disulfide interchange protein